MTDSTLYTVKITKYGDGSRRVIVSNQINKVGITVQPGESVGAAFVKGRKFLRGEL